MKSKQLDPERIEPVELQAADRWHQEQVRVGPIFAITAYGTYHVKQDALAAGCNEVFAKPLDLESLLGRIQSTLRHQNSNQVKYQTAGR